MGKKFLYKTILLACSFSFAFFAHASSIDMLGLAIDGRTRLVVANPEGERTGSHGASYYSESTNAQQKLHSHSQDIEYTNALLGTYTLNFRGQYNEQFTLDVRYIHDNQYQEQQFTLWADQQTSSVMEIELSLDSEGSLQISSAELGSPLGRAIKNGEKTSLSWGPVPEAVSYTVFYKYHDYPYYKKLTSTSTTGTATDINWVSYGSSGTPLNLYYFRVQAQLPGGRSSALSPIISNDDQDNDRYSDWREIELGTDPTNPDSDRDGIDDFFEQNRYYTDPLNPDSDGDGHTDGVEVSAGTLANNSDSYPRRVAHCDAPSTGVWHITSDCDVQRNQIVPDNIIVHPNTLLRIHENITVWFDYYRHKILVMFGAGIQLDSGANIKQK